MRFAEATSSLRPSAGGANEEAAFRARECRPATRSGSLLAAAPSPPNQGPDFSRTRLTFERPGAPRAFRGFDELDFRPTGLLDTSTEGPALRLSTGALRLFACPEHPFRGENDLGTSSRPDAFTFARRRTLVAPHGVSSAAPSRCFESTSTTDVSRHEHPFVEERRLRRLSSRRRGKARRRSASRTFRARCCHLASRDGAGPPCGHPASSGLVLDGTLPASGRSVTTLVRGTGGRAPEPCQLAEAPPKSTL